MIIKNPRVLITGGAGLIGSHIVDLLVSEKNLFECQEIIVIDNFIRGRRENLKYALNHGPLTIVEGDIRDRKLLKDVMQNIDIVFHQAAIRITQCVEEPRTALEVMVDGTFNILEEAIKAKVKKIIAASSASVYGLADEFPTNENHHTYNNRTLYGATKAFNEGLLRSFYDIYGLNYLSLRYFNVYGPRMDIYGKYTEVLIRWMESVTQGQSPTIFGNGSQTMDFVYVEDVAKANILAAQSNITDEIFNIASGTETSLNDLAKTLLKVMGSNLDLKYAPERKVNPVPRRLANVDKARRILNFEAKVSLKEGLQKLVAWWQNEKSPILL